MNWDGIRFRSAVTTPISLAREKQSFPVGLLSKLLSEGIPFTLNQGRGGGKGKGGGRGRN